MAVRVLAVLAALGLFCAPRVARADCPNGWFCDEKPAEPARPSAEPPPAPTSEPSRAVPPPAPEVDEPMDLVVPPYD